MKLLAHPFADQLPQFDPNAQYGDWQAAEAEHTRKLRDHVRGLSDYALAGETIRFPAADGYAMYMVVSREELLHLPYGDAWEIPAAHLRGLTEEDIVQLVRQEQALRSMFGSVR